MREAFSLQASGKSLPKETAKLALMEICPSVSGDVSPGRRVGRASRRAVFAPSGRLSRSFALPGAYTRSIASFWYKSHIRR